MVRQASLQQVCFVVMPFGRKETAVASPAWVDFDALWNEALEPALRQLGYRAVRADQDVGALIIKEMLERLYFSDLVLADVSIANANAYYEVGVRHAARTKGCVLIAADWARPVFDLAQVRQVRYPHPGERVDGEGARRIQEVLLAKLPEHAEGFSPMSEAIEGYPSAREDGRRARELADQLEEFETLRGEILAIGRLPKEERRAEAERFLARHPPESIRLGAVAVEVFQLVRDHLGDWSRTLAFLDALPPSLAATPFLREQRALALSKDGDHVRAIAALEALVKAHGDSSERQGLLGGRYKRLYDSSLKQGRPDPALMERAIEHYERGMYLDLNDYYPSCNLPALYRARGDEGDEERARAAAAVARIACERALRRGGGDEWLKPTLLGVAFAERNLAAARALAREVEREGGAAWKLEATLDELRRSTAQVSDPALREGLESIVDRLGGLA